MHKILSFLQENMSFAAETLFHGDLVAFPTETVYGLGGNAYDDEAVTKIFQYKGRPQFNPVSVCYANINDAAKDVELTKLAETLAERFLPGPLTIVLKRRENSRLSWLCSAGQETIGVRIPDSEIASALLSAVPFPLAAPSANRSSELSPTTAKAVSDSLKSNENLIILDGGQCKVGIESTIVDLSTSTPKLIRVGAILAEEIESICGVRIEKGKSLAASVKHYVPNKPLVMNATSAESDDALLAFGTPFANNCEYMLNLSLTADLNEAATNFFYMLHELDKTDAKRICVMPIPSQGIGAAINEKLKAGSEN